VSPVVQSKVTSPLGGGGGGCTVPQESKMIERGRWETN